MYPFLSFRAPRRSGRKRSSARDSAARRTIVVVSNNDWHDFWYQRQEFASRFGAGGYRVVFVNKTFTRMPKVGSFLAGRYRKGNRGYLTNPIPPGVEIVTPLWLPPYRLLRIANRHLIRKTLATVIGTNPVVIVYAPSYNALDLIGVVEASKTAYVNVHNYEATNVINDLLRAERDLIQSADFLFADSISNIHRLRQKLEDNSKPVICSPPGVALEVFGSAYRGDEVQRRRTLYYYGGIGPHLDLELYETLSREFRVVFVGKVSAALEGRLPRSIEVLPAIPMDDLGTVLREADVLTIFYVESAYIRAVIPAKLYECLATLKPLLVSGLSNLEVVADVIYDVHASPAEAKRVLADLPRSETQRVLAARGEHARTASWEARFEAFARAISEVRTETPHSIQSLGGTNE